MIVNHKYFNHQVFQSWEEYFNNPNNTKFSGFQHSPLTGYPFVCVSFARFQRITSGCIRVFDICDPRVMIENTIFFHCTHPVNGVCIFMNSTSGGQILMRYVCADYCYTTGSPIGQGQFCYLKLPDPNSYMNQMEYVSACECAPYFPDFILQQYTFYWKTIFTNCKNLNISHNNCHTYAGICFNSLETNCSVSFLTLFNNSISLWCCTTFYYGTNCLNFSNIIQNSIVSQQYGVLTSMYSTTSLYLCYFSDNNAHHTIYSTASTFTMIDCFFPQNISTFGEIHISSSHSYYPPLFTHFQTDHCDQILIMTSFLDASITKSVFLILIIVFL